MHKRELIGTINVWHPIKIQKYIVHVFSHYVGRGGTMFRTEPTRG